MQFSNRTVYGSSPTRAGVSLARTGLITNRLINSMRYILFRFLENQFLINLSLFTCF